MAKKIIGNEKPIGVKSIFEDKDDNIQTFGGLNLLVSENPVLDNVAFSIVQTSEKLYAVYSVEFNTKGEAGKVNLVIDNLDLFEAQYQFKLAVTDAGLFNILDKV